MACPAWKASGRGRSMPKTAWPGSNPVTPSPTSSMKPAISTPGIAGRDGLPSRPRRLDVGLVAGVSLLDRWSRVSTRLAFGPSAREWHEATGVPELVAFREALLAERPPVVGSYRHLDIGVAESGNPVTVSVDLWHS